VRSVSLWWAFVNPWL